jgi:hypothetical protein
MRTKMLIVTLTAAALAAGCTKEEDPSPSEAAAPTDTAPTWLLASAPADALEVAAAKQTVAEGDEVVLHGRIGGRTDPMSTETGMFVMMDVAIPSCADMEEDHCTTPWDYCCEPSDSLAENAATVLLVDESGKQIETDLHEAGLSPLDKVIVVGTVGPRPDPDVLTIRATAIHRVGG